MHTRMEGEICTPEWRVKYAHQNGGWNMHTRMEGEICTPEWRVKYAHQNGGWNMHTRLAGWNMHTRMEGEIYTQGWWDEICTPEWRVKYAHKVGGMIVIAAKKTEATHDKDNHVDNNEWRNTTLVSNLEVKHTWLRNLCYNNEKMRGVKSKPT